MKDGDNGEVVFHTHNGPEDAWRPLKDECRRLGLLPERKRPAGGAWRQTGCYEYADADGAVSYRTVRRERDGERKQFVAQRPDGRGGWITGMGDVPRILYRLPDILAADPAAVVYLTEGERKADKLASWGLVATAVAFGAKGWQAAYAKTLAGRTVVILPDNDDEGRGFADRAAKSIAAADGRAFIVALPGLPTKGDIMDWRGSADQLRELTAAAIEAGAPPAPAPATFPLIDPATWQDRMAPPRQWAWHEWVPARQTTYLTGAGSSGKSLLAQQLATHIAIGRPFLGVETRQAVALYITCEDDGPELHRRGLAICETMKIEPRDLSGRLHLVSLSGAIGNELAVFDAQGRMGTTGAWDTLHATVRHTGARFIVLDNVAHLFAGNENIRNQVAAFCGLLNRLAADADAAVLLIGHPNKAGDSFSGSTAWENQMRSRIFLDRVHDDDGDVIDADARRLSRAKANYARNGETLDFRWHDWAFVQEGDLAPGLHARIEAVAQANAYDDLFLKCLAKANEERRATSPNKTASNYAPRMFAQMTIGRGASENGLAAAMERLLHLGKIRNGERIYQRDNRAWVTGLAVAPTLAPTPAPTSARGRTDPPPTRGESRTDLHALTPLHTTYEGNKDPDWPSGVPFDGYADDDEMPL